MPDDNDISSNVPEASEIAVPQKPTKSLAQRHIAKLRKESLELRAQSDTFTAEVAALEELFQRGEDKEAAGDEESEKKIWESLQRLLHKRYLAEMNSLRTAAALTGRQLPMKAPSTSSEEDSSYASSPASNLPKDKLDDLGSRLTSSGESGSDHGKSANDSTDTPPLSEKNDHSNDEGSASDKSEGQSEEIEPESEGQGSVFSFKTGHKKHLTPTLTDMVLGVVHEPYTPPSEGFVPKPRWFSGTKDTGRLGVHPPSPPFGAVLGSTVPPAAVSTCNEMEHKCQPSARSFTYASHSAKRFATMECSASALRNSMDVRSLPCQEKTKAPLHEPALAAQKDTSRSDYSAPTMVEAKCALAMERSAAALMNSAEVISAPFREKTKAPSRESPPAALKGASRSDYSAAKMAEAKCAVAMERTAAALRNPMEVPPKPIQQKTQAPLREPAPAAPKDRSRSELLAMAREARAAAAKISGHVEETAARQEMRVHSARNQLDMAPYPPHLKDMADELKQQISDLQSSLGPYRRKVSMPPEEEVDHRHREAVLAKARETMERAPQVKESTFGGSGPYPSPTHAGNPAPSPRSIGNVTPRTPGNRDHTLGLSAPCLPTYAREPRRSPRASPRGSQSPFRPQELHSTAPTVARFSPTAGSRGGRVSPSSSPVQHGRQGRGVPPAFANQGCGQPQFPQGRPGHGWMQSPLAGFR